MEIAREIHPACSLPSNEETIVWRYMSLEKFQSLLDQEALYLCRADRLQDKFEGTYSLEQITDMDSWLKREGLSSVSGAEKERRKNDRLKSYINCWCMYEHDVDLMWKGYVGNSPGVAIKSSIKKLTKICDNAITLWPLDVSTVQYYDQAYGEFIDYFGTPDVFLKKDKHFILDNEVRLIYHPNIGIPSPDHIFLPVDLALLIEEVVMKPKSSIAELQQVRDLLDKKGLKCIPVTFSRDDRDVVE